MDSSGGGGAYGAGKATGQFDLLTYIKKPHVIARVVSLVFSVIVFGCIASQGWFEGICLYGGDANACNYGVAIGVLAFINCVGMLVVDALFDNMSNVNTRKYAVLADLGASGLFTLLWFVGFCYLTNKWTTASVYSKALAAVRGKSDVEAAIAFSFFSIVSWGLLTFLAVKRYREGVSAEFTSGGQYPDPNQQQQQQQPQQQVTAAPYSVYPGGDQADSFQQPPFTGIDSKPQQQQQQQQQQQDQYKIPADYRPPTY